MSEPGREYHNVETQFREAEKEIRKLISGSEVLQHIQAMSAAFNWHASENRELQTRIGELERELHGQDRQQDAQLAKIRAAAAARAEIAAKIMAEMKAMVPAALAQAKKGKPALLRLILRSTR